MATRVALQYGVLTGGRVGRHFCAALRNAGYELVDDARSADIIIGHSAGCFWLPQAPTKQRLVLINPPYWPGKSVKERAKSRANSHLHFRRFGYSFSQWLWRTGWGMYYGIFDMHRNRLMARVAREYELDKIIQNHQALIIRNTHDDWLTPAAKALLDPHKDVKVVEIAGDHDNLWLNPAPYIAAIQEFTK